MSASREASDDDIRGINSVIEANRKESKAAYRYPCIFDEQGRLNDSDRILFVTEVENTIIAFLSLHGLSKGSTAGTAEFEVVVHPNHRSRKKHYGENLLRYVIEVVRQQQRVKQLRAMILHNNTASIKLCKKIGFSVIGCDRKGCTLALNV